MAQENRMRLSANCAYLFDKHAEVIGTILCRVKIYRTKRRMTPKLEKCVVGRTAVLFYGIIPRLTNRMSKLRFLKLIALPSEKSLLRSYVLLTRHNFQVILCRTMQEKIVICVKRKRFKGCRKEVRRVVDGGGEGRGGGHVVQLCKLYDIEPLKCYLN